MKGQNTPPELAAKIVALKLKKVRSVEIMEQTGASGHVVEKVWQEYRRAHPGTPHVGVGAYAQRQARLRQLNAKKHLTNAERAERQGLIFNHNGKASGFAII